MKKTIKYIVALAIGCSIFTSCEDPYANQTIASPGSYKQGNLQDTTSFAAAIKTGVSPVTVLSSNLNDSLSLISCSSAPILVDTSATVSYKLQISGTSSFAKSYNMPFSFKGKAGSDFKISYKNLNDTIFAINSSAEERTVYAKVSAYITKSGLKTLLKEYILNFTASPIPMKAYTAVTPRPWYIVGLGGHWDNSNGGLGSSLVPLNVVSGNNYNDNGDGKFTYTGYFKASDGFKILRNIGDWDNDIWGMTGSTYTHNGGGNISVAADGYYTITLNSITNTLSIVSTTAPKASYTSIGLIGGFNGWGTDVVMTPSQASNNHTWYTTQTFAADGGCKFRADGAWTTSWGGDTFPIGMSGGDIPAKAGTYKVLFNDIDGCFYFIKQ